MIEPLVKIEHLREARFGGAGLCTRGARIWFARHNLDFRHFLMYGYPVSVIEATGDALGILVAKIAREDSED